MDYYGCVDVTDMPLKVFSKADEYSYMIRNVWKILGLSNEINEEDDLEAAKN